MKSRKIQVSHKGRTCKQPGCKQKLSIYNHAAHCHVHLDRLAKQPTSAGPEK